MPGPAGVQGSQRPGHTGDEQRNDHAPAQGRPRGWRPTHDSTEPIAERDAAFSSAWFGPWASAPVDSIIRSGVGLLVSRPITSAYGPATSAATTMRLTLPVKARGHGQRHALIACAPTSTKSTAGR